MSEVAEPTRRRALYADAPRILGEEGEVVDLRHVVRGRWLELEIGPGPRAGFLLERAAAQPDAGLIALEIRRKWAAVGDARLARHGFGARARVFCEDARFALPRLGPDGSVRRVYLHFPDPWWKKRHEKRLVVATDLLDHVARLLASGGELFIQTDVDERAELYASTVDRHGAFTPAGDREGEAAVVDHDFDARSPREHRAIADGLPIFRMRWRRR